LRYADVVPVVTQYGDALADKVIIDISNPFNAEADGPAIPEDTSIAQDVATAAPASANVVKAFNTVFGHVLKEGRTLDVFFAGDDEHAKAGVSEFSASLGLRPLDVGGLTMAHWLEGTGLVLMGLALLGWGTSRSHSEPPNSPAPGRQVEQSTNAGAVLPTSLVMDHREVSRCQMSVQYDDRLPEKGSRDEAWFRHSHRRACYQQRRWSERVLPRTRGSWLRHAVGRRSPGHAG
jgi:hypothetical protein